MIVCLGTDGLASSPSLGILDEVRVLHERDPSLSGPLLLTMATLFTAPGPSGSTTSPAQSRPRQSAIDLAVVALPDRDAADPHELILEGEGPVVATMVDGEFVSGRWATT